MKLNEIFIGRFAYWAVAGVVVVVLAVLGLNAQHVKTFVPFQFTVLGLAVFVVAAIMCLYRPGERITREPLKPDHLDRA